MIHVGSKNKSKFMQNETMFSVVGAGTAGGVSGCDCGRFARNAAVPLLGFSVMIILI